MSESFSVSKDYVYASIIFGRGLYRFNDEYIADPIVCKDDNTMDCPIFQNILTGEKFFLRCLSCSAENVAYIAKCILDAPNSSRILWPKDMVTITSDLAAKCTHTIPQGHSTAFCSKDEKTAALLFPFSRHPRRVSLSQKLAQIKNHSWRNPSVIVLAASILRAFEYLNRGGYIYCDIHPSRFFFESDGIMFFDYSNLICSTMDAEVISLGDKPAYNVTFGDYPIEYAEPALVCGVINGVDFQYQNYSLASLLFYILFNRHPYDGRLFDEYLDDTLQHRYEKAMAFHKAPVFIFDPMNSSNALGAFEEELMFVELWEDCPSIIKDMFVGVLSQDNAMRRVISDNPTPSQWLQAFKAAKWI